MNIKFGIKCCIKYEDRLKACVETWAKDQDIVLSTDLTQTDLVEGYDSLTRKSRRFFGTTTFKPGQWFLYCDDDTYVNVEALESYVATLDPHRVIVVGRGCMPCRPKTKRFEDGQLNKFTEVPRHTLFQGGAGTLLSYPALLALQLMIWTDRAPAHDLFLAEDQWVTATIRAYGELMGMYLGHKQTMTFGGGKEIEEKFQTLYNEKSIQRVANGEAFTLHHVPPQGMHDIHKLRTELKNEQSTRTMDRDSRS